MKFDSILSDRVCRVYDTARDWLKVRYCHGLSDGNIYTYRIRSAQISPSVAAREPTRPSSSVTRSW